MTNSTIAGTAGGTILSVIISSSLWTTIITAALGATVAFFISLFWKWAMSDLNERIEIQARLKQMIPLIKKKRDLNNQIDKMQKNKKK